MSSPTSTVKEKLENNKGIGALETYIDHFNENGPYRHGEIWSPVSRKEISRLFHMRRSTDALQALTWASPAN